MIPEKQKHGYLILKKPELVFDDYIKSIFATKNSEYLQFLRKEFPNINPVDYKGMWRQQLMPWGVNATNELGIEIKGEKKARELFQKIVGEDRNRWDGYEWGYERNKGLIYSSDDAILIYNELENKTNYEVVWVSRDDISENGELLGFDVGYWHDDMFSILCDCSIYPLWHPPVPESVNELKKKLNCLNHNQLFPTTSSAEEFRNYYIEQNWSEKENYPNEFCIVRLEKPKAFENE